MINGAIEVQWLDLVNKIHTSLFPEKHAFSAFIVLYLFALKYRCPFLPPLEFLRCPRLTLFIFNSSISLILSISFLQAIPPSLAAVCTGQGCRVWRSPAHRVMRSGSKDTMRPCTVPPSIVQLSSWASRGQLCDVRKLQQAHTHTHTLREKQAFSWVLAVTAEGPALRFGSRAPFLKPFISHICDVCFCNESL